MNGVNTNSDFNGLDVTVQVSERLRKACSHRLCSEGKTGLNCNRKTVIYEENNVLEKWKRSGSILKGFLLYAACCIILTAVAFAVQTPAAQTTVYADGNEENQGVLIAEDTEIELEFEMQTDELQGLRFYYYDNGITFDEEKICFELYEGQSEVPLATQEVKLGLQSNETPIFVKCSVSGGKGKRMRLRIYGVGIRGKEGPSLGYAAWENIACVLRVNGSTQEKALHFMAYAPGKKNIFLSVIRLVCLLLGGALCCFWFRKGALVTRKSKKARPKAERPHFHVKTAVLSGVIFLALFAVLEYTYSQSVKGAANKQEVEALVEAQDSDKYIELSAERDIYQEIICPMQNMSGVGLTVLAGDNIQASQITLQVTGEDKVLFEKAYDVNALLEKGKEKDGVILLKLKFPIVLRQSEGQVLTFQWRADSARSGLLLRMTEDGSKVVCNGYFSIYECLKVLYFLLAAAAALIVSAIFYGCCFRSWDADKVFFLAVLLWGMVYCGVLTVYSVPDEPSHIDTAYRISNEMLGIEDDGIQNALLKRNEDIEVNVSEKTGVSAGSYLELYGAFSEKDQDETLSQVYVRNNLSNVPSIFYFAPALGISFGRILGMGRIPVLLLGRLCSLLLAACMMYYGVKKLPFGKAIFYVVGLLPITLQEIMSFSYDSFLIGLSYLFAGYLFSWLYGGEKPSILETGIFLGAAVLFALAKGGVYLPLAAGTLLLLPFKERMGRRESCRAFAALAVLVILSYLVQYPNILVRLGAVRASAAGLGTGSLVSYSMTELIRHPLRLIRLMENTWYDKGDIYLKGLLGGSLGWLDIRIAWYVVAAFLVLLVLAVIPGASERCIGKTGDRVWIWLLCAVSIGLIFLSMLVSATPVDEDIILGVQGRYFLPLLGIGLAAIPAGYIRNRKKRNQNYILAGSLLQILVISQILMEVL